MRILVLDRNVEYAGRLKYFGSKKYPQMQISVCDDLKAAMRLMQETAFDVVLFDAEFDDITQETLAPMLGRTAFAYISETNEIINDCETIMKYIRVSEMYEKICTMYEKKRNRVVRKDKGEPGQEKNVEIITFLPVHGGAGSSTMAAACALSFAKEYDVLYLNLEQRPSDAVFFDSDNKKGISHIVSALKTKYTDPGMLNMLNEIIQKDKKQKYSCVNYIRGYSNIMDCTSMTVSCLDALLRLLREKMHYRYIIIDADFIVSPVLNKLITSSDKLVLVSSGADIANNKLQKIQRYLDILKREDNSEMPENYLLLNQYYGMNDERIIARDMEIIAKIARYRTGDHTRISSQGIIDEVLSKKQVFAALRPAQAEAEENA